MKTLLHKKLQHGRLLTDRYTLVFLWSTDRNVHRKYLRFEIFQRIYVRDVLKTL